MTGEASPRDRPPGTVRDGSGMGTAVDGMGGARLVTAVRSGWGAR